MSFTALILKDDLISRRKIKPDQLKCSGCRIQHRIESPGSGILIGLQFPDKVGKQSVSVLAGYAVSGSKGSVETCWITGVPHRNDLCSLCVSEAGKKQCHVDSHCEPSHSSSKLSCLCERDRGASIAGGGRRAEQNRTPWWVRSSGKVQNCHHYCTLRSNAVLCRAGRATLQLRIPQALRIGRLKLASDCDGARPVR